MALSEPQFAVGVPRYGSGYVFQCDGAWVQAQARNRAMVLTLGGDVDAANMEIVTATLIRFASLRSPLIFDTRRLNFLAVSGFRALVALGYQYREAGVPWVLVTGAALQPYLRVADSRSALPVANSVDEAMRRLKPAMSSRRQLLRIVAPSATRC